MDKFEYSHYKKLIIQITLTIFVLLQTISQFHLHLDEHDHENEHQCITCHITTNSVTLNTNIDLKLISLVFLILITKFNCSLVLNRNNYKYSFTSRSPPLL